MALAKNELTTAATRYHEALRLAIEHNSDWGIAFALDGIGCLGISAGMVILGVRVHAAGRAEQERLGTVHSPRDRTRSEQVSALARNALGHRQAEQEREAGRNLTRDEALRTADSILDHWIDDTRRNRSKSNSDVAAFDLHRDAPNPPLTPREREVLQLLVAGRSNREIAEALFVSHRTATTHVTNILAKLGTDTRTEAAAITVRQGLV